MNVISRIDDYIEIFECPGCHKGSLILGNDTLICSSCNREYRIIEGIPDLVVTSERGIAKRDDLHNESFSRWNEFYKTDDKKKDDIGFGRLSEEHVQVFEDSGILKGVSAKEFILDIGCGKGYVPYGLSKLGKITIGVDFIFDALLFAKRKFEEENLLGLFVRADISNLPFKKESFKFIYSLGVLEHHRNINEPVNEIFRTLKYNGFTFNVVPALSISSLTYGQLWGSIPNFFIFKDIFYWFHHRLLKGRHCVYGYELNYLEYQLREIFKSSGFCVNEPGVFGITVPLYSIENKFLKSLAESLIKNRLFTRHIYIKSKKV